MLVDALFRRLIQIGSLTVTDARGREHLYTGQSPGPHIHVRFHNVRMEFALLRNASMALGRGYMDGWWSVVDGTLYDCLDMLMRNVEIAGRPFGNRLFQRLMFPLRRFLQWNPAFRARRNVAHHYDLSRELYELFLDDDRQYSCAYFRSPDDTLEAAQENKKRLIAGKLCLEPGQTVLDIGCGWGGLALHLAREHDVKVTGLTLSNEQLAVARQRAREAGLDERVRFELRDYRHETGRFDRVVSVGMFEHVGISHYRTYFDRVHNLLNDDGAALIHTIGRMEGPGVTDAWIRTYIFPGGYLPSLSEFAASAEESGLWMTDVEILRLHYAETLRHWRHRFLARRDAAKSLYDERFCRMWEYYLAICETSFRYLRNTVFQVQLGRRLDSVPLTRDYLGDIDFVSADFRGSSASPGPLPQSNDNTAPPHRRQGQG